MLGLFYLVVALLTPLIGAYFIANSITSLIGRRLANSKKWVRLIAPIVAFIVSFIAIACLSVIVMAYAGMFTR